MGFCLALFASLAIRLMYRILRAIENRFREGNDKKGDNVMIIGAGEVGRQLLRELRNNPAVCGTVRCFIDDNPYKKNKYIDGIKIVGDRNDISYYVDKYGIERIIYSIAKVSKKDRTEVLNICKETGCKVQAVPGMAEMLTSNIKLRDLKDVDVLDLLERKEVRVNDSQIKENLKGKTVMVTGGGGSIGSELCRQIAAANPKCLIIFDIYENNAYEIQQELIRKYPELNLQTLIGSVRNTNRVNSILEEFKPDIIFHAAAHKHVPLMEDSPNEAIKNNVLGTYKLAQAACANNVKRFVLISTDKAVNPTNIMGASKRLCEMIVQMMNRRSLTTDFVAVRFGNVLGSNGSVIPLFKKQIAEGGPVTVTDKNIIRYFMTISEAVSLVLQAECYAKGGEIFVLDMGDPVRIDDMARNLIKLSGYVPDVDIKIEYTGLRPGEKLYEELLMDEEGLQSTDNNLIHIGKPIEMDDKEFEKQIDRLDKASRGECGDIKSIVAEVVTTYKPKTV